MRSPEPDHRNTGISHSPYFTGLLRTNTSVLDRQTAFQRDRITGCDKTARRMVIILLTTGFTVNVLPSVETRHTVGVGQADRQTGRKSLAIIIGFMQYFTNRSPEQRIGECRKPRARTGQSQYYLYTARVVFHFICWSGRWKFEKVIKFYYSHLNV